MEKNKDECMNFIVFRSFWKQPTNQSAIVTPGGATYASVGYYIIKGGYNEFTTCSEIDFVRTYERVALPEVDKE